MGTLLDKADFIIDGKDAKELNLLCDKFNRVKVEFSQLEKEKKELTAGIKNILADEQGIIQSGHYTSNKYDVQISITPSRLTIDVAELQKKDPALFQALISQYPKSTSETVTLKNVTLRGNV